MFALMVLFVFPTGASALSWDLPSGVHEREAESGDLKKVQALPDRGLRLVFAAGKDHGLVVVNGTYEMTAQKYSDYHVTLTVGSISIGKKATERVERMGWEFRKGQAYRVTTSYDCVQGRTWLQLCLHGDKPDGSPHVVCRELPDPSSKCAPLKRNPGELINQPLEPLNTESNLIK